MVIDGKLEKTKHRAGKIVSEWKPITGGAPQLFIGPAERVDKKWDGVTVAFLLPRGRYKPHYVESVGDLLIHAYRLYTDWFGPLCADAKFTWGATTYFEPEPRLAEMKQAMRGGHYRRFRASEDVNVRAECEAEHLSWPRRADRLTRCMCEAQRVVICPEESSVFTHTVASATLTTSAPSEINSTTSFPARVRGSSPSLTWPIFV